MSLLEFPELSFPPLPNHPDVYAETITEEEFVAIYGKDALDGAMEQEVEISGEISWYDGNPTCLVTEYLAQFEDVKTGVVWEISFYDNIGESKVHSITKV